MNELEQFLRDRSLLDWFPYSNRMNVLFLDYYVR